MNCKYCHGDGCDACRPERYGVDTDGRWGPLPKQPPRILDGVKAWIKTPEEIPEVVREKILAEAKVVSERLNYVVFLTHYGRYSNKDWRFTARLDYDTAYEDDGNTRCQGLALRVYWVRLIGRVEQDAGQDAGMLFHSVYHGSISDAVVISQEINWRERDGKLLWRAGNPEVAVFGFSGHEKGSRIDNHYTKHGLAEILRRVKEIDARQATEAVMEDRLATFERRQKDGL